MLLTAETGLSRADDRPDPAVQQGYERGIQPLLKKYCYECHSGDLIEAEVDFEAFQTVDSMRKRLRTWQRVADMLDNGQMPPKDATQPSAEERAAFQKWVRTFLATEAATRAGDPGRVVLRRLDNAEYTYTIRDLTGVPSLDPAREFPVDGAAGEGFTNTGNALVMSPALVSKYLDAAKGIAGHAVLLPDGFRFSPQNSRRDWTEETLTRIRDFYGKFTASGGGSAVNLQGIQFNTNQGGRLPIEKYLTATLTARADLSGGKTTIEAVARDRGLNAKYLGTLWRILSAETPEKPSLLLDRLRSRWKAAKPENVASIVAEIEQWQRALWKFNSIGHIGRSLGRKDGPQAWMEPVEPLAARQDVRIKLTAAPGEKDLTLHLVTANAGNGGDDFVVWENPRLVSPGRPDLPLRDLRRFATGLAQQRERIYASAAKCLAAAAEADGKLDRAEIVRLAERHGVDIPILSAWLEYLGLGAEPARVDSYLAQKLEKLGTYDFIKSWQGGDDLSVIANSSDQHVRIPGNMKPHSVAVHPAPSRSVVVGWRSPVADKIRIEGIVQHAHPECGNGTAWSLELRRGKTRQRLAGGVARGAAVKIAPIANLTVRPGDLISLAVSSKDGNHSCDLTAVDLTLRGTDRLWDLARDVSPDILAGNPHADSFGHKDVWNFSSESDRGGLQGGIPAGSALARWQSAPSPEAKRKIGDEVQRLLIGGVQDLAKDSPDRVLHQQLTSLSGPLLSAVRESLASGRIGVASAENGPGLDPTLFGKHPDGSPIDPLSLCVKAPSAISVRLPADLVEGCEFVTSGTLHASSEVGGSVQLQAQTNQPTFSELSPALPVIVGDQGTARARFAAAFEDVRQLFPPALCYARIVPIDEVVTLNLYYREDDALKRLMLDDRQAAELDRLWDELLYVSQEPFLLASVFEQLVEFATQDRPDMVKSLTPMRGPVNLRSDAFRKRLVETEPEHLRALHEFAARAYRRPLRDPETRQLNELYAGLRKQELPHEEAFRLTLARVLVSPSYLYRAEAAGPGNAQHPVTSHELASRLSYFLWSSLPDAELARVAAEGRLQDPEVLIAQTRRMLRDPKTRRLATEFSAQWLHIYDFDQIDEKSERHFPTFASLRGPMYEESILFLTDLFRKDRPVLNLLDADYTFLNERLAGHYGIPGVKGPEWRRVDGVRAHGRGGILTQATTLSKQSGASRTSPILRGNWLSEVILGERLPRPPKNVPQLPETAPQGLTERQLIEKHSSDPACAKCHVRIDPMGFTLESFDAIGRLRQKDAAGLAIDTRTQLQDGTKLSGVDGLRDYLMGNRRDAFVNQFNRKFLGYALGRSVQLSDEPLLSDMHAALKKNDYRVSAALEAVVLSRQFREIRGGGQSDSE